MKISLTAALFALVSATHFDDIPAINNLQFDHVMFKTKKDCALDNYPAMKTFLEVESAHYPKLDVRVASDGQSRIELFNDGKKVDTIHVYKWDIQSVRDLCTDLGLERDEKVTWESKAKAQELAGYFFNNKADGEDGKMKVEL